MLRRVALILFSLLVLGVAAILAAGHLGINLPWEIAAVDHESPSTNRDDAKSPDAAAEKALRETTAALEGAPGAEPPSGSVVLDISRISPDGTSVFAGRADPETYVTVLEDGKPAGTVKTDSNGEWSLSTEYKFTSNDPKLTYQVSRTAPPAPEPTKIAKATPASPSAASVAGDVMRKFENLVEEAREEAKKTGDAKQADAPGETVTAIAPAGASKAASAPSAAEQKNTSVATLPVEEKSTSSAAAGGTAATDSSKRTGSASAESAASGTASATVTVSPPSTDKGTSSGAQTNVIPVPIMFVYNEAVLTLEGKRATELLLEYLTLKHLSAVELTGHADERGTNDYNFDLSRERLETVSQLLKQGGFAGDLKLTPKGKTEPYMGVDRTAYSGEALYQLDRRVELRVRR